MFLLLAACFTENAHLVHQLDDEVVAQQQRVRMLEERLSRCDARDVDPIYGELVQALAGQPAVVAHEGGTTTVTISTETLFSTGVALRAEAAPLVDLLATSLSSHPERRVTVLVYADGDPDRTLRKQYPTAWELTAARAAAMVRELVEHHGVPPAMLTAAGRADLDPIGTTDTPEGRALNRRVVLRISPGSP